MHGQRQPPRRGEGLGALVDETRLDQRVGDELAQILRRLPLHAGGDFLGEQFEQKVGHGVSDAAVEGRRLLVEGTAEVTRDGGRTTVVQMRPRIG